MVYIPYQIDVLNSRLNSNNFRGGDAFGECLCNSMEVQEKVVDAGDLDQDSFPTC